MTSWRIPVPMRSRDDSLSAVGGFVRHLPDPEDRAVARHIAVDAATSRGMATAGELCDWLDGLDTASRRTVLDEARAACGLPSTDDVEALARVETANVASLSRLRESKSGSGLQLCHSRSGCNAVPTSNMGLPIEAGVTKWFCPEHVGEAAAGDMLAPPSNLRISPSGALVEIDMDEQARQAEAALSRERQHAAILQDRQTDAAARAEHDRARDERYNQELPPHLRPVST
jgi:hypothetical protein